MATRNYIDDVVKQARKREYNIVPLGNDRVNIVELTDALEVVGSTFGKANALGDMVLECEAAVSGTTVTVSHPGGTPSQIWFVSPVKYGPGYTFRFKAGSAAPVTMQMLGTNMEALDDEAFGSGAIVTLALKRVGSSIQAFFKQGGGALKMGIIVVGGATRPASPKEYTIWVPNAVVGDVWYSKSQPTAPTQGMVWVLCDTTQPYSIRTSPKAHLYLPVGAVRWYNNGGWQVTDAMIFINGAWQLLSNRLLFNNGIENVPFHGSDVPGSYGAGKYKWNSGNSIWLGIAGASNDYSSGVSYTTRDKVNLTPFRTLNCRVTNTTSGGNYCQLVLGVYSGNVPTTANQWQRTPNNAIAYTVNNSWGASHFSMSVNIANITGDYWVGPCMFSWLNGSTGYNIVEVWLD